MYINFSAIVPFKYQILPLWGVGPTLGNTGLECSRRYVNNAIFLSVNLNTESLVFPHPP